MSEKLYAPAYYERFSCIADKCRHSCCVNWEIDVDDEAMKKYASAPHGYAATVLSSIDETGDDRHFALCADGRCPHLDECGLCNIILRMGEEYLCHICREHPRFYHETAGGREVGLGMCCEEACRLILSSDDFHSFVEVGHGVRETASVTLPFLREKVYGILSDPSLSYRQKRQRIEEEFAIPHDLFEDEGLMASLEEMEYLEEGHRALLVGYDPWSEVAKGWETYLDRALAYFLFRHVTEDEGEEEARASVALSLFLERLLVSLIATARPADFEEMANLARILSEELEYSEDNLAALRFELFSIL